MHRKTHIVLILLIAFTAFALSCAKENVNQLKETKDTAEKAATSMGGDVINTAKEAAGEKEQPEEEKPAKPKEGGEEGGGDNPMMPKGPSEGPPVQPIEGQVTVSSLIYPTINPATGKYEKPDVGDVPSYTTITEDPFLVVIGYYDQLLAGHDYETRNSINNPTMPPHATYMIHEGDDRLSVNISGTSDGKGFVIVAAKL
jgi:hypothetical protein